MERDAGLSGPQTMPPGAGEHQVVQGLPGAQGSVISTTSHFGNERPDRGCWWEFPLPVKLFDAIPTLDEFSFDAST
jgi:hypothetical protein